MGLLSVSIANKDTWPRGPSAPSLSARLLVHQVDVDPLSNKAYVVVTSCFPRPLTLTAWYNRQSFTLMPGFENWTTVLQSGVTSDWRLQIRGCRIYVWLPWLLRSSLFLLKPATRASWNDCRCSHVIAHRSMVQPREPLQPLVKCACVRNPFFAQPSITNKLQLVFTWFSYGLSAGFQLVTTAAQETFEAGSQGRICICMNRNEITPISHSVSEALRWICRSSKTMHPMRTGWPEPWVHFVTIFFDNRV